MRKVNVIHRQVTNSKAMVEKLSLRLLKSKLMGPMVSKLSLRKPFSEEAARKLGSKTMSI
jgi:hypothetical protein